MLLQYLAIAKVLFVCVHISNSIHVQNSTFPGGTGEETTSSHSSPLFNNTCRLLGDGGWFRLICDTPSTSIALPVYPTIISEKVFALVIRNQPRLHRLTSNDLARFPALSELTITHSGLSFIGALTFAKNKHLKKVTIRSNALKTLDWRAVVNLREATLDVSHNPFECNCSLFWLAAWNTDLAKKRSFSSPDGTEFFISTADAMTLPKEILHLDALQCVHNGSGAPLRLSEWRYTGSRATPPAGCSLPVTDMEPKIIAAHDKLPQDSLAAQFQCSINSSQALDVKFRQTFQLKVADVHDTRNRMSITRRGLESGTATFNLLLPNVTQGQMGWYVCVGLSASGPSFDMAALVVHSKPRLRLLAQNRSRQIDHFVDTFGFIIQAYPRPTNFTWLKNNFSINFTDNAFKHAFSVMDEESRHLRAKGFFYASRLTFLVKFRYKPRFFEGVYSLTACNALGCDSLDFVTYDQSTLPPNVELSNNTETGRIMSAAEGGIIAEHGWIVAAGSMGVGLFMFGMGLVFYFLRRLHRRTENNNRRWIPTDPDAHGPTGRRLVRNGGGLDAASVQLSSYTSNAVYEPLLSASVPLVPRESLEVARTLGEGAFGQVHLAYCKLNSLVSRHAQDKQRQQQGTERSASTEAHSASEECCPVAAKMLKRCSIDRSQDVAREAELMAKLNHPNIVTFYGVCIKGDELLLLYEYMELGDLKRFLNLHGPSPELAVDDYSSLAAAETWRLSDNQLIDIACQIARGLAYLHDNHFVHRDLACRNCLVKGPLVVKLSDFGMTRDIYSSDYYRLTHKAPLPVRWLPPESLLYGRFSNLSDVWSYGVVMWEIATYGKQPWYEYSNVEVMERVNNGETLAPPADCHPVLGQLMLDCWKHTPKERVKLSEIVQRLSSVLCDT